MIPVRQSTAFETAIGPVLDADGVAVTGCVVGDFKIKKTTGNFAALNGSATLTHVSAGVYDLVLTTSDLDTVGLCVIAIDDTVNACQSLYLQVIEEAAYDAVYAASAPGYVTDQPVNVTKWLGTAAATPTVAGVPEVDITHALGTALTEGAGGRLAGGIVKFFNVASPTGTVNSLPDAAAGTAGTGLALAEGQMNLKDNAITSAKIATDAITSTGLAASAVSEIQSGLSTHSAADVWAVATRALTILDEDSTTLDLDATIRAALGMSSANLDAQLIGVTPIRTGTAQTGTSSSITLDASASSVADFYARTWVRITSGTGVGQVRLITSYNGTSKVANTTAWATTPDNTSVFAILPQAGVDTRMWLGTAPNALMSGRVDASIGNMQADSLTAAATASDFGTEVGSAVWASGTRTLSALGFSLGASDFGTDWLTSTGLAASAVNEIWASVADSAGVTTLLSRLTSTRAGYLDNLSGGSVALASAVAALDQILKADEIIDDSGSPWEKVYLQSGTANELFRKRLLTVAGGPITSTDDVIGQSLA